MAMRCGRTDGYGMIIAVGSAFKGKSGQKKEYNPPYAHIWSLDKTYENGFRIDSSKVPQKANELTPVDEKDAPLGKYADKVLEWAKQPSIRYKGSNCEAMRQSWRDIQEVMHKGLAKPWHM
jgi:hypothetical protein